MKKNPNRAQAISPTDVRGILRRGCREALAAVEFTTTAGERYEAKWTLRLKRTDNYDKVVRSLQRLAPHKETIPEAEIDRRIPEIIGLDYTQFTRTVMLAQNSFANFLRAGRSEKSALLEKLTGTEIYGQISRTIHEQTVEAQQSVEILTSNLQEIMKNHLSDDELAAKKEEYSLASATIKTLTERQQLVQQQLQWFADFDEAISLVARLEEQYAGANKAYMSLRGDELRLERYDSVLDVQPLFQEIKMRRATSSKSSATKSARRTTSFRSVANSGKLAKPSTRRGSAFLRPKDASLCAAQPSVGAMCSTERYAALKAN